MKSLLPKREAKNVSSLVSDLFTPEKFRSLLSITFLMLLTFQTYGQDDWTLSAEKDGVKIYHQLSECDGEPVALLKFANTSADSLKVEWFEFAQLEGVADEFQLASTPFTIYLGSNQSVEGSCTPEIYLQSKSRPNAFYALKTRDPNDTTSMSDIDNYSIESFRVELQRIQKLN